MYAKTSDLPEAIQRALSEVSYHRKDIEVEAAEEISPLGAGGAGRREFFAIVDLSSGRYGVEWGSWGGANIFNQQNRVDLDRGRYRIPANVAVVKGSSGGNHPTWAHVYVRPDMLAPLLPQAASSVTPRERWVLYTFSGLTSAGRKDEWSRRRHPPSEAELTAMIARGWLKRNKAGATQITTEGRNASSRTAGVSVEYAGPEERSGNPAARFSRVLNPWSRS